MSSTTNHKKLSQGKLFEYIEKETWKTEPQPYIFEVIETRHINKQLQEAKAELLTFKQFADAGMMKEKKPDFSDIYSVYISDKIKKWFGESP
jgi:hypothetical protein